jgi:hypothetical protein
MIKHLNRNLKLTLTCYNALYRVEGLPVETVARNCICQILDFSIYNFNVIFIAEAG